MAEEIINPPVAPVQEAPPPPRLDGTDKLVFAMTTLIALLVYLVTLSQNVTLEESGILSTAAAYAGVPGPPGMPVWTLYSWVFTKVLPFSNIAWRVAVGSAVAGALLCGIVAMTISFSANVIFKNVGLFQKITAGEWNKLRTVCGAAAGLVLGFSSPFWHEAVLVDCWSLSLLLFATVLWLLTRGCFDSSRRGLPGLAFLFFGMMLTSNQELLVALPGFVCLMMFSNVNLGRDLAIFVLPPALALNLTNSWSQISDFDSFWPLSPWSQPIPAAFAIVFLLGIVAAIVTKMLASEWKATLLAGIGLTAGLAFFLYLPLASMSTPPVNWAYPRTLDGFLHAISRGQYERCQPTGSLERFGQQLWGFFKNTGDEFGWLYLAIALVGACALCAINSRGRRWLAGLAAVFICTGPFLLAMLNPSPGLQGGGTTEIYSNASRIILAVLMGMGLVVLGAWAARSPVKV